MGSPRRLRKKYETPGMLWDEERMVLEHSLKEKYGLKNLRELWIVESELRRIRKNIRNIQAGKESEETGKEIIERLAKYGIVSADTPFDALLNLAPDAFLSRRLQTIVFQKGLARSLAQARQLIVHGFIAINGRKVRAPGYLVKAGEEAGIGYYKPIQIQPKESESEAKGEGSAGQAASQSQAEGAEGE